MFDNYGLFLYWDTGEECFVATSSEMMICRGIGNTRQEALIALEQDIESWRNTQRVLEWPGSKSGQQEIELFPVKQPDHTNVVSQPKATIQRKEIIREIVVGRVRLGIRIENEKPIVHLSGEISLYTASGLKTAIDELLASGTPNIFIDLTEVMYMDSSGFGTFLPVLRKLRHEHSTDGKLILIGANPLIDRMLQITRLNAVFSVYETMHDAEEDLIASK